MGILEQVPTGSILVGVDGSPCGQLALDWAADQASLEGLPLVLLHATAFPWQLGAAWVNSMGIDQSRLLRELEDESQHLLSDAAARVVGRHAELDVRRVVQLGDPREALLDAARNASAVVVGSRGLGPVRSMLLGSVSLALAKHASAPVVVLRSAPRQPAGPVVLAVRNGEVDRRAVEFAYRIASSRGLDLVVLHCFWDVVEVSEGACDVPDDEPGLDDQRAILTTAIAGMTEAFPQVPVRLQLTRGFVDKRLIRASESAGLIVLGHHRKPLLNEIYIGSVAPLVVEHAHCSVAVVPDP